MKHLLPHTKLEQTRDALALRARPALLILFLVFSAPLTAAAEDGVTVTVTAPYTDMRTGPGGGYPIHHIAERHEKLHLLKRRTDWYKVATADGKTGWVKREHLDGAQTEDGAALDFASPDWHSYTDDRWELGVMGGDYSGSRGTHLHLGFRASSHFSAELRYIQAFSDFSDSKLASVNILHRPFPDWRLAPFFTLGAGAVRISPHTILVESEERENNLYTAGAGLVYYLTHRFALRAEYNHHTLLTNRDDNEEVEEWKAGFTVSF